MRNLLLISMCIAVLPPLIIANGGIYCKNDDSRAFNICGYKDAITSVIRAQDGSRIVLNVGDFSSIAPYAFREITVPWLELRMRFPTSEGCIPKDLELTPESFDGLHSLEHLDLQCVKLPNQPNLFTNLTSLTKVAFERVDFEGSVQEFLAGFPHIKELHFTVVNLTTISPSTFSTVNEGLEVLSIHHGINFVEPKSFERLHNLKTLVLSRIRLDDLQSDMFNGLNQLSYLNLQGNKIPTIQRDVFSQLGQLRSLSLIQNGIREIEVEAFSNLVNLRHLELDNNNLESLTVGVFHNLRNLIDLNLSYNKIKTVPYDVFRGCENLKQLYLWYNQIHDIEPTAFWDLHLENLHLDHNNIKILKHDTFTGLRVETLLDLSYNNITVIEPLAFRNLKGGVRSELIISLRSNNVGEVDRDKWGVNDSIRQIWV